MYVLFHIVIFFSSILIHYFISMSSLPSLYLRSAYAPKPIYGWDLEGSYSGLITYLRRTPPWLAQKPLYGIFHFFTDDLMELLYFSSFFKDSIFLRNSSLPP